MTIVERFLQLRTELDAVYEAYWAAESPSQILEVLQVVDMLQEEIKELKKQKLQGKIEYRKPDDYTQVMEIGSSTASNLSSEVLTNQPSDKPAGLGRFPVIHRDGDLIEQTWRDSLHPIRAPQRFTLAERIVMDALIPRTFNVPNWFSSLYIRIKNFAKGVFHGGSTGTPVG